MRRTAMDRRSPSAPRRARGATLLEAVFAVLLLGISVPPILGFFRQGTLSSIAPERQTAAYFLAMERMEEIIADRHSSTRGYSYLTAAHYPAESLAGGFTRTAAFNEVSSADLTTHQSGTGYLLITVTVQYSAPAGSYAISSLVCDRS
jgi:Tfp pilus assembly protein PilV